MVIPLSILFLLACNKDSDLLVEYVVNDPKEILLNEISVSTLTNQSILIEPIDQETYKEPEKVIITEVTPPKMGEVEIKGNNSIVYIPKPNETGTDEFKYTTSITNPNNTTSTQTGNISVTISNKPTNLDYGPLKAFPTAFGAGANASGARASKNAAVYHVTNLNDSGPGSLREGISGVGTKNNRYIVFEVSGTIYLKSVLYCHASNITIAGQTAPKGGITLAGNVVQFGGNPAPKNIIMRYINIRPDFKKTEQDALGFFNSSNVILDHVSVSWGTDEIASMAGSINNITFQRMLIGESNKTGTLVGNSNNPSAGSGFSFFNNLWYNISHRFPNINTDGEAEIINNVVYNWNYRLSNIQGGVRLNHINNYYFRQRTNEYGNNLNKYNGRLRSRDPLIYTAGNIIAPNVFTDPLADNWGMWSSFQSWEYQSKKFDLNKPEKLPLIFKAKNQHPLLGIPFPIKPASVAFEDVIRDVGNNKRIDRYGNVIYETDKIDAIYLQNVRNDSP